MGVSPASLSQTNQSFWLFYFGEILRGSCGNDRRHNSSVAPGIRNCSWAAAGATRMDLKARVETDQGRRQDLAAPVDTATEPHRDSAPTHERMGMAGTGKEG